MGKWINLLINRKNPEIYEIIRKFPILGCHLLDGCLLAPV